jgi:hypothetical protein
MSSHLDADGLTDFERRYLAGTAYDVTCATYQRNRAAMLQRIRERHERLQVAREAAEDAYQREVRELWAAAELETHDGRYLDACIRLLQVHERHYAIKVSIIAEKKSSDGACHRSPLEILIPPTTCLDSLATRAHEDGHLINPPCPGTFPHMMTHVATHVAGEVRIVRRDIQCELDASRTAVRLIPFRPSMVDDLQEAMRGRMEKLGTQAAQAAARAFASTWRREQQRCVAAAWMHDMGAESRARASRRAQQILDINEIARGAQR